jgi:glucosamine--fructose-6-phosphate aminotransferase (isomerizing)
MLDSTLPLLVVDPSSRVSGEADELMALARERGSPVVAISDRREVLQGADAALELPAGVPEWLSPLTAVIPGQMWAGWLARARGHEPDAPRGLSKVTETR